MRALRILLLLVWMAGTVVLWLVVLLWASKGNRPAFVAAASASTAGLLSAISSWSVARENNLAQDERASRAARLTAYGEVMTTLSLYNAYREKAQEWDSLSEQHRASGKPEASVVSLAARSLEAFNNAEALVPKILGALNGARYVSSATTRPALDQLLETYATLSSQIESPVLFDLSGLNSAQDRETLDTVATTAPTGKHASIANSGPGTT